MREIFILDGAYQPDVDQRLHNIGRFNQAAPVIGEMVLGSSEPVERWQDLALCAQTDPDTFIPDHANFGREAKRVCLSCEVRVDCLEAALDNDEPHGVWGGLNERERRKLKKRAS